MSNLIKPDQTPPVGSGGLHPAHGMVARGFAQTFGLDVRAAILTVFVDVLANSATIVSAGLLWPVELLAGIVLAFIVYKIQRSWYADEHDSALIKALIVGLVTAIPAPITPIIAIPGGIIGLFQAIRRRFH